ncbi:hypothetical protein BT69DRAFT_1082309 [Atractiella rhizophila]|nr:hypothetical protein BT69DRAFT_1082309 [Atractiella rhizophila]
MPLKIPFRRRTTSTNKLAEPSSPPPPVPEAVPIPQQVTPAPLADDPSPSAGSHLSMAFSEDYRAVEAFLAAGGRISEDGNGNPANGASNNVQNEVEYGGRGTFTTSTTPEPEPTTVYSDTPMSVSSALDRSYSPAPSISSRHPAALLPGMRRPTEAHGKQLSVSPLPSPALTSTPRGPSPQPPASPMSVSSFSTSTQPTAYSVHTHSRNGSANDLPPPKSQSRATGSSLAISTSASPDKEKDKDKGIFSVFQRSRGRKTSAVGTASHSPTTSPTSNRPTLSSLVTSMEQGPPGPKSSQTLADLAASDPQLEPPPASRFGFFRSRNSSKERMNTGGSANSSQASLGIGTPKDEKLPPSSFQLKGFRAISYNSESPVTEKAPGLPSVNPNANANEHRRSRSRTVGEGFVVVRSGKGSLDLDRLAGNHGGGGGGHGGRNIGSSASALGHGERLEVSRGGHGQGRRMSDYEVADEGDRVSAARFMEAAKMRSSPSLPFANAPGARSANGRESPALGLDLPPVLRDDRPRELPPGAAPLQPPRKPFAEMSREGSSTSLSTSETGSYVKIGKSDGEPKISGFQVADVKGSVAAGGKKGKKEKKKGYQKMYGRKAFGSSDESEGESDGETVESDDPYGDPEDEEEEKAEIRRKLSRMRREERSQKSVVEMAEDAKEWELGELLGWTNFVGKKEAPSASGAGKQGKKGPEAHRRMTSIETSLQPPAPPFAQIRPTRSSTDLQAQAKNHERTTSQSSTSSNKPVGWGSEDGPRKSKLGKREMSTSSQPPSRTATPTLGSPAQISKELPVPQPQPSVQKKMSRGKKGKQKEEESSSDDDVPLAKLMPTSSAGSLPVSPIEGPPRLMHKTSKSTFLTPSPPAASNRQHSYSQSAHLSTSSSNFLSPASAAASSSTRVHAPSPIPPPSAFANRPKVSSSLAANPSFQAGPRSLSDMSLVRKTSGTSLNSASTMTHAPASAPSRPTALPSLPTIMSVSSKAESPPKNLKPPNGAKNLHDSPASSTSGSGRSTSDGSNLLKSPNVASVSSSMTSDASKVSLKREPSRRMSMVSLSRKISTGRRQNSYAGEMSALAAGVTLGVDKSAEEKERQDQYKRMQERHRKEAKKAIAIGNELNGPGPKVENWAHGAGDDSDDEDDVPLGMKSYAGSTIGGPTSTIGRSTGMASALTVPTINPYLNPQAPIASTSGLNINALPAPPGVDPVLYASLPPDQKMSLHQRGQMMMQMMAMAAQQAKAASEAGHAKK